MMMIVFTMYFSGGLIPFYLLIKDLKLVDNIFSMILPSGVSIMYMTVIRQNFESLPAELEESARIDGANDLTILFRILLPPGADSSHVRALLRCRALERVVQRHAVYPQLLKSGHCS